MVLLHVKRQDESLFFYETTTNEKVAHVLEQIVLIQNSRAQMADVSATLQKLENNLSDGDETKADLLKRAASEIDVVLSKKLVEASAPLSATHCNEVLNNVNEMLNLVFSAKIPDEIQMALEKPSKALEVDETSLWFAGKEMKTDKVLSEYLGKNEKSKVIIKLQKKNQGPPIRETGLTEEDQSQLMLRAFRRQQELEVSRN